MRVARRAAGAGAGSASLDVIQGPDQSATPLDLAGLHSDKVPDAQETFTRLFRAHHATLVRATLRLYGRNQTDAEDIVQALFIRLWRERKKVRVDLPVSVMLLTRLRTAALNFHRSARSRRFHLTVGPEPLEGIACTRATPAESADRQAAYNEVLHAASRLSWRCWQVFQMKFIEDLADKEIASRLGTSIKTVRSQILQSRKQVRHLLGVKTE
jgi:RNA polymerase sigma-70 factor (ECF subfamily)